MGDHRKLAGQVKRTFTVSAADDECKQAVQDFWKDFRDSHQFKPTTDRLALVALRGTNLLIEHFSGLLDCSRAAHDGTEFERRLATPGFLSAKAVQYCNELQKIIGETEERSVSAAEIWPFLRVLHVLSLDLNSATRQTEAMVKTLLAHTAREQDALGAAEATWNALLREVGGEMPAARRFRYNDLPKPLRQRHSVVGGSELRALRALGDHSALILGGIRSTIGGGLHLVRGRLVQQVVQQLESSQVVLVTGPAGSGKSSIAKDAVTILEAEHFVFSFRAEEFAHPHFDETLQSSQIPASAAMLGAILAGQGRKVLLVESVERLLERSTRDAFTDLLTLVATDKSWGLVLTCRDYSADLVRTCFLESSSVGHSVVTVPPLDDGELAEVGAAYPTLARPLANVALRRVLRNPYTLDKALRIPWSEDRPLPQSEREFRDLFWKEIVRSEHHFASGMPRRREDVFMQIALRRARALALYAACGDLDPEVVATLRRDSLIVSPHDSDVLAAPAHDVLEDWSILHWIDEQYVTHESIFPGFPAAIGAHPAIRRTYRKWVSELVGRDAVAADRFFQIAVREAGLPAQFRDDTIVSLLRSPFSTAFLERHLSELFENAQRLLRRVIHLLRVACVTTPAWLETSPAQPSLFNVPDGPAWACVLRLVQNQVQAFAQEDRLLLLGFIEDWSRGVSWQTPYPEGSEAAAAIAHWLLAGFDDYPSQDQRRRTLQIIAKIPNSDPERFAALLQGGHDGQPHRVAMDFREIIISSLDGTPAARDVPDILVSAANDHLLFTEADLERDRMHWASLDLGPLFGVKDGSGHGFFPASAYRGPFLSLLRHHPRKGLDFILAVSNHSADWYANQRVPSEYVEPPFKITLTPANGESRTQWANSRLWNLYRGTSVGPYVLQSLLMALERWLLEFAEAWPGQLDAILLEILQRSESAATTAVAASVATAFPHSCSETIMVLLQSRECILLDRRRLASDSHSESSDLFQQLDPKSRLFYDERKASATLPHRRQDLEFAVANLQLGPLASRVHAMLDRHREEMPPIDQQDERDRVWRLALHRMDLRQYVVADDTLTEDAAESEVNREGRITRENAPQHIRLNLKPVEPDVQEMAERSAADFDAMKVRLGLLHWGMRVFRHEVLGDDLSQWRQMLQQARTAGEGESRSDNHDLGQGGPGFVAAVCIRDHWDDLSDAERSWCVDVVCSEVERDADQWNDQARVQRFDMSPDRSSAWVLPLLIGKALEDPQASRVSRAIVLALTHAIDEVRDYATLGVGKHLWQIDRGMTLRCIDAIATSATKAQQALDAENDTPYDQRRRINEIEWEVAALVREQFFAGNAIIDDAYQTMDQETPFGIKAAGRILAILGQAPSEDAAIAAFERLASMIARWWDIDEDRRSDRHEWHQRDYQAEALLSHLLRNFLLRTSEVAASRIVQPVLDATNRHPREVGRLLQGLISAEDQQPNTPQFWYLWDLFVDRVRCATWLARIDTEYASGKEMISATFLGTYWKDEVRHWRSIEGYAHKVHQAFAELPPSSIILEDYLQFLYHVGEQSLPRAFIYVANRLRQGDPRQMMRRSNTVFLLEVLLQGYVYGRPLELKRERDLRDAVLFLLDLLVENGSSAGFRMRDDFVTPVATDPEGGAA